MPPKVSIITVYYNTPEDLQRLHASMLRLPAGEYEFLVADNDSRQSMESRLPGCAYLRLPENRGFGAANNAAAQKASAPALFFVNPDCEFVENCLPALLSALETADVCGPAVLNEDRSLQLSFGPFLSVASEAAQKLRMRFEKSRRLQARLRNSPPSHPDYVSGCALMIRTETFRRLGGFDENFFLYNEDVDLCKRVRDAGGDVRYVPAARILHARNKSVGGEPGRARAEYRKSREYYYRKHHGRLQNALLRLYNACRGEDARSRMQDPR